VAALIQLKDASATPRRSIVGAVPEHGDRYAERPVAGTRVGRGRQRAASQLGHLAGADSFGVRPGAKARNGAGEVVEALDLPAEPPAEALIALPPWWREGIAATVSACGDATSSPHKGGPISDAGGP
jgi:hypothetical protein